MRDPLTVLRLLEQVEVSAADAKRVSRRVILGLLLILAGLAVQLIVAVIQMVIR